MEVFSYFNNSKILLFWSVVFISYFLFLKVIYPLFEKLLLKTTWKGDEYIFKTYKLPISFFILYLLLRGFQPVFEVSLPTTLENSLIILTIFTFIIQSINLVKVVLEQHKKFNQHSHILNFLFQIAKFSTFILALLTLLQNIGYDVKTLIASLGIGGLAVALAAKDTISNIFGGLNLILDNSLSKGEWVLIDGKYEGIVHEIGIRSLKLRTFNKTLLTLPNSKVANSSVENFSRRKVRRIKFDLNLSYETSPEKVEIFIEKLRNFLQENPNISKEHVILVYLKEIKDYAYTIMVYCFANTSDWEKWLEIRQEVLLMISRLLKELQINLAPSFLQIKLESGK